MALDPPVSCPPGARTHPLIRLSIAAPRGTPCGIGDYAQFLADGLEADAAIRWVDLPRTAGRRAWRQAARSANQADIVHVHYETDLFYSVKPYRNRFATFMTALQRPAVVTLHDALPELAPYYGRKQPYRWKDFLRDMAYIPCFRSWEGRQYNRGRHWLVHIRAHAERIAAYIGPARVSHITHPIPATTRLWRLDDTKQTTFVTPGFIKPHKGYEDFLPVLAGNPQWRWTIAGGPQDERDTAYQRQLMAAVKRAGLKARVHMTGYLSRAALEDSGTTSTLAVFPFRRAVGSGSITWAVGMGLPVLATNCAAIRQMRDAGMGIELLPVKEPRLWIEIANNLVHNPERMKSLANANRTYARQHSYHVMGAAVNTIYRKVLDEDRRKTAR